MYRCILCTFRSVASPFRYRKRKPRTPETFVFAATSAHANMGCAKVNIASLHTQSSLSPRLILWGTKKDKKWRKTNIFFEAAFFLFYFFVLPVPWFLIARVFPRKTWFVCADAARSTQPHGGEARQRKIDGALSTARLTYFSVIYVGIPTLSFCFAIRSATSLCKRSPAGGVAGRIPNIFFSSPL